MAQAIKAFVNNKYRNKTLANYLESQTYLLVRFWYKSSEFLALSVLNYRLNGRVFAYFLLDK